MDVSAFLDAVHGVRASAAPSAGDDLLGMEIDFFAYLQRPEELDDSELIVRRTSKPEALIVASCAARPGVKPADAAEAVHKVGREDLRYGYFEASAVELLEDRAVVHCLTQIGEGGFYVTATITVLPAKS